MRIIVEKFNVDLFVKGILVVENFATDRLIFLNLKNIKFISYMAI